MNVIIIIIYIMCYLPKFFRTTGVKSISSGSTLARKTTTSASCRPAARSSDMQTSPAAPESGSIARMPCTRIYNHARLPIRLTAQGKSLRKLMQNFPSGSRPRAKVCENNLRNFPSGSRPRAKVRENNLRNFSFRHSAQDKSLRKQSCKTFPSGTQPRTKSAKSTCKISLPALSLGQKFCESNLQSFPFQHSAQGKSLRKPHAKFPFWHSA